MLLQGHCCARYRAASRTPAECSLSLAHFANGVQECGHGAQATSQLRNARPSPASPHCAHHFHCYSKASRKNCVGIQHQRNCCPILPTLLTNLRNSPLIASGALPTPFPFMHCSRSAAQRANHLGTAHPMYLRHLGDNNCNLRVVDSSKSPCILCSELRRPTSPNTVLCILPTRETSALRMSKTLLCCSSAALMDSRQANTEHDGPTPQHALKQRKTAV